MESPNGRLYTASKTALENGPKRKTFASREQAVEWLREQVEEDPAVKEYSHREPDRDHQTDTLRIDVGEGKVAGVVRGSESDFQVERVRKHLRRAMEGLEDVDDPSASLSIEQELLNANRAMGGEADDLFMDE